MLRMAQFASEIKSKAYYHCKNMKTKALVESVNLLMDTNALTTGTLLRV